MDGEMKKKMIGRIREELLRCQDPEYRKRRLPEHGKELAEASVLFPED